MRGRLHLRGLKAYASNAAGEGGLQKLVERARKEPMTVSYASTGYDANAHVGMEGFSQAAGIKLIHAEATDAP